MECDENLFLYEKFEEWLELIRSKPHLTSNVRKVMRSLKVVESPIENECDAIKVNGIGKGLAGRVRVWLQKAGRYKAPQVGPPKQKKRKRNPSKKKRKKQKLQLWIPVRDSNEALFLIGLAILKRDGKSPADKYEILAALEGEKWTDHTRLMDRKIWGETAGGLIHVNVVRREAAKEHEGHGQYELTEAGLDLAERHLREHRGEKQLSPITNIEIYSKVRSQKQLPKVKKKPYKCPHCSKLYVLEKAMKKHVKTKHGGMTELNSETLPELPALRAERSEPQKLILLIDNREKGGWKRCRRGTYFHEELRKRGIATEIRTLSLGDFTWVLRTQSREEKVFNLIVERKRIKDLASSLKDNRYDEQKYRLGLSKIPFKIYLVEGDPLQDLTYSRMTPAQIEQAAVRTEIINQILVIRSNNVQHTVLILTYLHVIMTQNENLMSRLASKELFSSFAMRTKKRQTLHAWQSFAKQLTMIDRLSEKKALKVVKKYATAKGIMNAYKSYEGNRRFMLKEELGAELSKKVFKFFHDDVYD